MPMTKVKRAKLALILWWCLWPLTHLGNMTLPEWFFEHVLLGLSVYAVIATKADDYHTLKLEESNGNSTGSP